jgi:hemerythrin
MKAEHVHSRAPRTVYSAVRHARRSLCNRLERMAGLPDEAFCQDFAGVVAAVEAAFRHEELVMEMLGYAHLRDQRAENAVILRALHRAIPAVDGGDCALGRQLVAALRDVLDLHRLSADLALAVGAPTLGTRAEARMGRQMGTQLRGRAARATQHVAALRRPLH